MSVDLKELEINAFLAQAEELARLVAHPAWPVYTSLLRDMRFAALEQLAVAPPAAVSHWQGVAAILDEIINRPMQVIEGAAAYQRTEESEKGTIRTELRAAMGLGLDHEGDI